MPEGFLRTHDDARLWFTVDGSGPPLLLANGGPGCGDYLGPVAAMLQARFRVVRFEPRGCGRSQHKGPYDVATALTDVQTLRAHIGASRWIVGGHSAGADLALATAMEHPDSTIGVLCLAGGRVHDDRQWHRVYDIGRTLRPETPPPGSEPYNLQVNARHSQSWKAFCKRPSLLRRLATLPLPVRYILAGDDIRPAWIYRQVAALVPDGGEAVVHGAGHNIWMTHAEPLRVALLQALDDITARAS